MLERSAHLYPVPFGADELCFDKGINSNGHRLALKDKGGCHNSMSCCNDQ